MPAPPVVSGRQKVQSNTLDAEAQKAIRKTDGKTLEDLFTRTRAVRRSIIDARQA